MPRSKKNLIPEEAPSDTGEQNLTPKQSRWRAPRIFRAPEHLLRRAVHLERQLLFSLQPSKWPSLQQLRHSARVFSKRERQIIMGSFGLLIIALAWFATARALPHIRTVAKSGGTYIEGEIGTPRAINPLYASTSSVDTDLTRLVFAGLFRYDHNLQPKPDLASSYEISADGRTYTVRLKDGLMWHDGDPLTIDDVVFTFTSITAPESESTLADSFQNIVVEKIDDQTIQFTLKDPYSAFLNLLTTGIIPQHIWSKIPIEKWRTSEQNLRPVGAGLWQFDALARNADNSIKQISLLSAPVRPNQPAPYLEHLIFKFYGDDTSAINALNTHDIQGLAGLTSADLDDVTSQWHLIDYPLAYPAVTGIFFNLASSSPVADTNVRKALRAAIHVPDLLQHISGDTTSAAGPFPNTIASQTSQDETKSPEELLNSAGWNRIGALWKNKEDETLSLVLSVVDRPSDRAVAAYAQTAWQRLGIDVKLDLVSPATASAIEQRLLRPRAYQALVFTEVYGAAIDPYPFWHSSARVDPGLNLSGYTNKEADDLIEKIRRTEGATERQALLATLAGHIYDDAPAIFLFSPVLHYLVTDAVKGVSINRMAVPADRFTTIEKWFQKTSGQFVP